MKKPKIALAHEFLVQYGGAERTLEAIAEIFPEAPIYTAKYDAKNMPEDLRNRTIISPKSSWINKASKYFFTFMMAPVFEGFDFNEYDIVISDGNTWNKGIITKPDQLHITYVHTPPRFLYGYSTESTKRNKWYFKLVFSYIDNILRLWDYVAAQRPDFLLTNSEETRKRIQKFYRRDAKVIYPPVDTNTNIKTTSNNMVKPYYIAVGRLIKYKNFDILINAFNILGLPLVIVGNGAYEKNLRKMAGPNIIFKGAVTHAEKTQLVQNALGLINPVKDEDFGIVPVEALAQGIPVLAHKSGGHKETVIEGVNGMFFSELSVGHLTQRIKDFDEAIRTKAFSQDKIKESAQKYSKTRFQQELKEFVEKAWENFENKRA